MKSGHETKSIDCGLFKESHNMKTNPHKSNHTVQD